MELRECPFCGITPIEFNDGRIECLNEQCAIQPYTDKFNRTQWNTRASDAAIKELVDALEEIRDALYLGWDKEEIEQTIKPLLAKYKEV